MSQWGWRAGVPLRLSLPSEEFSSTLGDKSRRLQTQQQTLDKAANLWRFY